MNSVSAPNRFNSIPYGSESQDKATRGQHSRKLMTMKVGAAVLCGAALAAKMIASLRQGSSPTSDFGQMRMLATNETEPFSNQTNTSLLNETDPCAELNKDGGNYVPFDRSEYMKGELFYVGFFSVLALPCLLGLVCIGANIHLNDARVSPQEAVEESRQACSGGLFCLAVAAIAIGNSVHSYFEYKGMTDGECWIEPVDYGSRG